MNLSHKRRVGKDHMNFVSRAFEDKFAVPTKINH
jgi:hypothetical protein